MNCRNVAFMKILIRDDGCDGGRLERALYHLDRGEDSNETSKIV